MKSSQLSVSDDPLTWPQLVEDLVASVPTTMPATVRTERNGFINGFQFYLIQHGDVVPAQNVLRSIQALDAPYEAAAAAASTTTSTTTSTQTGAGSGSTTSPPADTGILDTISDALGGVDKKWIIIGAAVLAYFVMSDDGKRRR